MTGDGWVRAFGRILARERERERLLRAAVRFQAAAERAVRFLAESGGTPTAPRGSEPDGQAAGGIGGYGIGRRQFGQ